MDDERQVSSATQLVVQLAREHERDGGGHDGRN